MSEMDDFYRQREEAAEQYRQEKVKLWESLRTWEAKRAREIEEYERNQSNPNWGEFS